MRESQGEVTIWDVVILDNGVRADVIGTQTSDYEKGVDNDLDNSARPASFLSPGAGEETFSAMERANSITTGTSPHLTLPAGDQHQLSDEDIRFYIMKQLPQGSHASIRTETVTARTITVDIFDDDVADIAAPPGTMMIEERFHNDQSSVGTRRLPKHTVVFRTAFNQSESANLRSESFSDGPTLPESGARGESRDARIEEIHDSKHLDSRSGVIGSVDDSKGDDTAQDTTPSKSSSQENMNGRRRKMRRTQSPDGSHISTTPSNLVQEKRPRRALSSSSLSGSETPKNMFGKASFAKFAHKVKSGQGERSDTGKRSSLKKGPKKTLDTNTSTALLKTSKKAKEVAINRSPATTQSPSTKLASNTKQMTASQQPEHRVGSGIMNKGLPRVPRHNTAEFRSTPSSAASTVRPRGLPNRAPCHCDSTL